MRQGHKGKQANYSNGGSKPHSGPASSRRRKRYLYPFRQNIWPPGPLYLYLDQAGGRTAGRRRRRRAETGLSKDSGEGGRHHTGKGRRRTSSAGPRRRNMGRGTFLPHGKLGTGMAATSLPSSTTLPGSAFLPSYTCHSAMPACL